MKTLTGPAIVALMRKHHITIHDAAAIFDITLKRVRTVRAEGVQGDVYVWEWGTYLPVQHHRLKVELLEQGREGHPSFPPQDDDEETEEERDDRLLVEEAEVRAEDGSRSAALFLRQRARR